MLKFNPSKWQQLTCAAFCLSTLISCKTESQQIVFTGYVEAEWVYLSAPQSGWMIAMPWQAGDRILLNEEAFQLDNAQQLAAIKEAQARLEQASAQERNGITGAREEEIAELEAQKAQAIVALEFAASENIRWNKLVEQGLAPASKSSQVNADYATSVAKLDAIKASINVAKLGIRPELTNSAKAAQDAAQANLEQAQWQLSQRNVLSLAAGQIEEIFYRQGEFVIAGKPILAILPDNGLIVRFFVPQASLTDFIMGHSINVRADGLDTTVSARIFHIARSAEFTPPVIYDQQSRQKLMFLVEARLNKDAPLSSNIRPGLPVEVTH